MTVESPPVLLPYQQAWHLDDSKVRVAEKSRRIGFSWSSAAELALEAASADGQDGWYVGYNKDMALEYIRDCTFWARHFDEAVSDVEESIFEDSKKDRGILMYTLRFASGYRITALSSRPTNLRAKRGHIVIDEAAFHDDLPGLLKSAMAILMWGGNQRVDIISTHNGVDNHFNKIVDQCKAGKLPYSLHRVTFQEAVAQGLYRRICMVNNTEWSQEGQDAWVKSVYEFYGNDADEELDVIPAKSGGRYIGQAIVERAMVKRPVLRLECEDEFVTYEESMREGLTESWCVEELLPLLMKLPKNKQYYFGQDFGRVSDRSVIMPAYLDQDLTRQVPFVVELLNVPYEQQKQILFYLADRLPSLVSGHLDATGNGGALAEAALQRYGDDVITMVNMTDKWYRENLPPLRAAYEDDLIRQPRDVDHLNDLGMFRLVDGVPKLPKTKNKSVDVGGPPRHGDAGIASALMYSASRVEPITYEYTSGSKRTSRSSVDSGGGARKVKNRGIW